MKLPEKLLDRIAALIAQIRLYNQKHFVKILEKASTIDGQIPLFDYYPYLFIISQYTNAYMHI